MRRTATGAGTAMLLAFAVLGLVLNLTAPAGLDRSPLAEVVTLCDPILFGAVGGFLVLRRPHNAVGWMTGLVAAVTVVNSLGTGVVRQGAGGAGWALPLMPWGAWVDNWVWVVAIGGLVVGFLRFPSGRRPGRVWRVVEDVVVLACAAMAVLAAGLPYSVDFPGVAPPFPFDAGLDARLGGVLYGVLLTLVVAGIAAAVLSLLLRRRHAAGVERAQLRWLLWAAALVLTVNVVEVVVQAAGGTAPPVRDGLDLLSQVSVWGLPIAVAIAITRHGLFEIDRVVSRTVSYTVLLAAAYVAVVTAVTALVPADLGSVAVVAATLAVAALFVPVRRRIQAVVDHRFNRARFDAQTVVAAFAERTRGSGGRVSTEDDLVIAARQVYEPAHISVWLAPGGSRS